VNHQVLGIRTRGWRSRLHFLHRFEGPEPGGSLSQFRRTAIDRNPVEPGAERSLSSKRGDVTKGGDEDVLSEVFGVFRITGHMSAESVDPIPIGFEDFPERSGISLLTGGD